MRVSPSSFFLIRLKRCQQTFADLNRYAIRPSRSLSILYDHRDETSQLAKALIAKSPVFRDVVELEKTALSARSRRLFTLSAIYHATDDLLRGLELEDPKEMAELALAFWEEVAKHMGEWERVRRGDVTAGEVRQTTSTRTALFFRPWPGWVTPSYGNTRSNGRRSCQLSAKSIGDAPTVICGKVALCLAAGFQIRAKCFSDC